MSSRRSAMVTGVNVAMPQLRETEPPSRLALVEVWYGAAALLALYVVTKFA